LKSITFNGDYDPNNNPARKCKMLTKTAIALATALTLGTACVALAAPDTDPAGGFREEGAGGIVKDGVNPAFHPSMHKAGGDAAACEQRFRTYDPATGTFLGEDGKRHPC
jgi:BA14K-like protein